MKLTAPWHRKAPSQTGEPRPSSLNAISTQLDELSRKVDRLERVHPPVEPPVQSGDAIETAISGLRGIVAHVASADALASLDRDVRTLADKVSDGLPTRQSASADAIHNLEQRIGSIADAIAAFRAEGRQRTVRNMASLIEILNEKIEVLQAQQANPTRPLEVSARKQAGPLSDPNSGNLDSVERGIADLIKEVKEVRANTAQCSTGRARAPACNLERDLAELQQTHSVATRRTQDSLAAVHGTIDDLFERMASLESDMHDRAAARRGAPAPAPTPEPASEPVPAEPREPSLVPDSAPISDTESAGVLPPSDAPGFARLRHPGRADPRLVSPITGSPVAAWPEPRAEEESARGRKLGGVLLKAMVGVGLIAAIAGALLFVAPYLSARVSLNAPQARTVERGPRLDSAAPGLGQRSEPIKTMLADLPPSIGPGLVKSAVDGDASAAYEVGMRLSGGASTEAAGEQAVAWLERAARAGLTPALLALGSVYEKGVGVARDPQRARAYYLEAARKGNAKAMHNLAVLYAHGVGGKLDQAAAAEWFRKAAMRGVIDSQFNLAVLCERGAGVEQSVAEAYKWYALAARQGDAGAARKRDEIARQLDARTLTAMNSAIDAFVRETQSEDSTSVKLPPGGWDRGPAEPQPAPKRAPQFGRGIASLADETAARMR
jgi:localization factor PodJL